MKTLKDVYIKVTKRNFEKVSELLKSDNLPYGTIYFNFDDIKSWSLRNRDNVDLVTASQLKRLIETIPTREEITRLKRQISAYNTNLSLTNERCKELQSDNERLKNINLTLKQTNYYLYDKKDTLLKENKQLKQRKWWKIWNK